MTFLEQRLEMFDLMKAKTTLGLSKIPHEAIDVMKDFITQYHHDLITQIVQELEGMHRKDFENDVLCFGNGYNQALDDAIKMTKSL